MVERMIMQTRDSVSTSAERLNVLLKRPWDPAVTAVVSTHKQVSRISYYVYQPRCVLQYAYYIRPNCQLCLIRLV